MAALRASSAPTSTGSVILRALALPLVVVAVAAVLGVSARSAHADPPVTTETMPASAGWLARQLVDGERFETVIPPDTYANQGLTVDALFGLAAAGVAGTNMTKAITWLSNPAIGDGYYGGFDSDPVHGFYSGQLAKLAVAAQVAGQDPTSFGGRDLIATLLATQQLSGRFKDSTTGKDFLNGFGQALGTIALVRTGNHAAEATKAAAWLAGTECADGGYPALYDAPEPGQPACDGQVDTTAIVIEALLAAGDTDHATDALDWLITKQGADGGFGDDAFKNPLPENSNSAGLAAAALRTGGRTAAADKAVAFIKTLMVGCTGPAANRGAIAFGAAGFDDRALRSTTQALLGLGGANFATLTTKGAKPDGPVLDCPVPVVPMLPVTGDKVRPILFSGAALIVVGVGLLVLLRRRRTAQI